MARLNGLVKIEGTVEDLTFYKKDGKNFVRKKGGISRERIMNDPSFVRTRENGTEFAHCAAVAKSLRLALGSVLFKAKDNKLSSRMLQLMSKIKNLDGTSARGLRKVGIGLGLPEGKLHLKGFDFNQNAPLKSVLYAPLELDTATGIFSISDFVPREQLQYPQGATHVALQSALLQIDFDTEATELVLSNGVNLPIDLTASTVTLTPASVPAGTGVLLYLVFVSFYQEVNGQQYSLKNHEYNVLNVVEVL